MAHVLRFFSRICVPRGNLHSSSCLMCSSTLGSQPLIRSMLKEQLAAGHRRASPFFSQLLPAAAAPAALPALPVPTVARSSTAQLISLDSITATIAGATFSDSSS